MSLMSLPRGTSDMGYSSRRTVSLTGPLRECDVATVAISSLAIVKFSAFDRSPLCAGDVVDWFEFSDKLVGRIVMAGADGVT